MHGTQPKINNKLSIGTTELYHSTKKRQHSFTYLTACSSDTHQSMKTSDSNLKVNRNIYQNAVNVIGCVLLAPSVAN